VWVLPVFKNMLTLHLASLVAHRRLPFNIALTTTPLLCTDQMPSLSTLAFQTSYIQFHTASCHAQFIAASRGKPCNSHLPLHMVLGCRAVKCAQDSCTHDTWHRGQSQWHNLSLKAKAKDKSYCPQAKDMASKTPTLPKLYIIRKLIRYEKKTCPNAAKLPGTITTAVKTFLSLYKVIDSSFRITVILQQTDSVTHDKHKWVKK